METINGEWIMKGLDLEDPTAIHTIDECRDLIHTVGFLPLFSNAIPGFSVEEHVPSVQWWTGDPQTDPWEWRMILAEDESIAYGKFFNKTAGFISKQWFPTFANYRRNGYDFDALFEDELASFRSKKIMDVFELDEEAVGKEILSSEVKGLAGFSKDGGEKNFEGTITDLQMQTYLIFSRFDQKRNKKGQPYGWHLGVLFTPETKWGRGFVTCEYKDDPKESWEKIKERMHESFPEAGEADIQKLLGIKYPDEAAIKTAALTKKKEKKNKTADLPYPENLVTEIGLDLMFPGTGVYQPLTDDQQVGLVYAISTLKDREQTALRLRFEEHKTLQETADAFGLSRERARQFIKKAIWLLRQPLILMYIRDGYQGTLDRIEQHKKEVLESDQDDRTKAMAQVDIYDAGFSVRVTNCLHRSGLLTLGHAAELMQKDPLEMLKIRNLGKGALLEIVEKLEEYGVDCYEIRNVCSLDVKHRETIMELDPSVRLMNILLRCGYDTMEKVKELVVKNHETLLRMDGMGEKTLEELFSKLEKKGIDCRKARAACNPVEEKIEELVSLGISDRLYNILTRSGLDTIEKIRNQMENDPWKILRLDGLGKKYREELFQALEGAGVDCSDVREKAAVLGW